MAATDGGSRARDHRDRRWPVAASAAIGLVAISGVGAAGWNDPTALTVTGRGAAWPHSLTVVDESTTVAVFTDDRESTRSVFVSRQTTPGGAWEEPTVVVDGPDDGAWAPSVASAAGIVDVVWLQGDCLEGGRCSLLYRQSPDGGVTWLPPVTIVRSPRQGVMPSPMTPRIARSSDGQVSIAHSFNDGAVKVRTSLDGGTTWARPVKVGSTTNKPFLAQDYSSKEAFPVVAIGDDVMYVTFYATPSRLVLRRSRDRGVTWSPAKVITTDGDGMFPDLAASGRAAIVGYASGTRTDSWALVRRTTDRGVTWRAARSVAPRSGPAAFGPTVDVNAGTWVTSFQRCVTDRCRRTAVYVRTSDDRGGTWTPSERASPSALGSIAYAAGATVLGDIIVAFGAGGEPGFDIFVRGAATPEASGSRTR